jgi:imidazoleglycerol-phosphate dehydratase
MPRQAKIERKTNETSISLSLTVDGKGDRRIATPVPFFNHMLEAVAKHGLFDLQVDATGDVDVDPHHLVEDVGICLGQAFREALGDKTGITRYGDAVLPMDEALVSAAVDFGGRAAFVYRADALKGRRVGTFDVELGREFFGGFVSTALCNLHLEVRYGENAHHMIEALFKAFARATAAATRLDPRVQGVPSTKGTLTS